jgi:hypothetical protein
MNLIIFVSFVWWILLVGKNHCTLNMFLYAELSCLIQTVAGFVVHADWNSAGSLSENRPALPNITFFFTCRSSKLTVYYRRNKIWKKNQNIMVSSELTCFRIKFALTLHSLRVWRNISCTMLINRETRFPCRYK